ANDRARSLYERGIRLLDYDDALAKIEALHNLGDVCALVGRNDEALRHFEEMLRHAWLLDHRAKAGAAHGRIGRYYRRMGDLPRALGHFKTGHQLFGRAGDRRGVAAALDDIGKCHWMR